MALSFGSPWMAAGAGLGQGVGQGVMFGMQLAQQKQAAKRQQQHDAMNLLMQGMKNIPDDPEQGEAYMKFFGNVFEKSTGQKLPDIPWTKAKPWSDKFKAFEAEGIAAGLSPEQARNAALERSGLKGIKSGKEDKPNWVMVPDSSKPGGIGFVQGPAGNIKGSQPWAGPQYPVYGVTDQGIAPLPGIQQPGKPGFVHQPQTPAGQMPQTTESEVDLAPADVKKFDAWEAQYNATEDPKERAVIKKKIENAGGQIEEVKQPDGWFSTPSPKGMVIPPSTKKRTSVRTPGVGGVPEPSKKKKRDITTLSDEDLDKL